MSIKTKQDFLNAMKTGNECTITDGNKTFMTIHKAVWAIDKFGNEYFPKKHDGKAYFEMTYDKFKGVHNEVSNEDL